MNLVGDVFGGALLSMTFGDKGSGSFVRLDLQP